MYKKINRIHSDLRHPSGLTYPDISSLACVVLGSMTGGAGGAGGAGSVVSPLAVLKARCLLSVM